MVVCILSAIVRTKTSDVSTWASEVCVQPSVVSANFGLMAIKFGSLPKLL